MLKMFFISCIIPLFLLSCEKNDTEIPSSKGIMSFYDKNKEGIDINGLDGANDHLTLLNVLTGISQ